MTMTSDASKVSLYVNDALYRRIVAQFDDWQRDATLLDDFKIRDEAMQLLAREARYLDAHDYEAWLSLFTLECIYWVPGTPQRGDPRRELGLVRPDEYVFVLPKGDGKYGQADLGGNLYEWLTDWYDSTWYSGGGATCVNCANRAHPISFALG